MHFRCRISRLPDGRFAVEYDDPGHGPLRVTAATRELALDKMRGELRYRLELCPCSGQSYQHLEIDLVEQPGGG